MSAQSKSLSWIGPLVFALAGLAWLLYRWPTPGDSTTAVPTPTAEAGAPSAPPVSLSDPRPLEAGSREVPATEAVSNEPDPSVAEQVTQDGPATAFLDVQVTSTTDGKPLPGVAVSTLELVAGAGEYSTAVPDSPPTDTEGRVRIEVPAGVGLFVLVAGAKPWDDVGHTKLDALVDGEVREVSLSWHAGPDAAFHGIVLGDDSGRPLPGARIFLVDAQPFDAWLSNSVAKTDASGRFELARSSWEDEKIWVDAPGYGPCVVNLVAGSSQAAPVEIRLLLESRLRVRLVDHLDRAMSGKRVSIEAGFIGGWGSTSGSLRQTMPDVTWTELTDADGRALFMGLPPRIGLRIFVHTEGLPRAMPGEIELLPGRTTEHRIVWSEHATIRGRVIDQYGAPFARVAVVLTDQLEGGIPGKPAFMMDGGNPAKYDRTDAEGYFELRQVIPGAWWVGIKPHRLSGSEQEALEAPTPVAIAVTAQPAGDHEVLIEAHRGIFIRGHVVDWEGRIAQAWVSAHSANYSVGSSHQLGMSSRKSGFFLGPLVPGPYVLQANGGGAPSLPIEVEAGQSDVVLTLRQGALLTGSVSPAKEGAGAFVYLSQDNGDGISAAQVGEDGAFKARNLTPGTYHLVAIANNGSAAVLHGVAVALGDPPPPVRLDLEPGGRVNLTLGESEHPVVARLFLGGAVCGITRVEPNSPQVMTVPAGDLEVAWSTPGARDERREPITVPAGQTVRVTVGE